MIKKSFLLKREKKTQNNFLNNIVIYGAEGREAKIYPFSSIIQKLI